MPLRPLLLPAMAVAAVLGATGAAVLVAGDESATRPAASAPAVTVTVDEAPATTAPGGTLDPAVADGQGDGNDQGGQGDDMPLPSLVGMRLDEATSVLDERGLQREIDGGGLFGVLDDSGWTVCGTTPEAGADVVPEDVVIVHVDRSCV
jgi:hypothetical protein